MNKLNKINFLMMIIGFLSISSLYAQQGVGIGTESPDASAILDVQSTTQGVLPPRMTTAERNLISSPATGLIVYNTDDNCIQLNNGTPLAPNWHCLATTQFKILLNQEASNTFDWSVRYDFFEFTSGGQLTLPLPSDPLYKNKIIHIRNRRGANINYSGGNGIGYPLDITFISNVSAQILYSDGTNWHLVGGRT